MDNTKTDIAVRILAGFCANPAIFAPNGNTGWSLVNCTYEQLSQFALDLAASLLEQEKADNACKRSGIV